MSQTPSHMRLKKALSKATGCHLSEGKSILTYNSTSDIETHH